MKPRKIMITGVAGFIGSHLADRLLEDGQEVFGFDIAPEDQAHNLKNALTSPLFHYATGDMTSAADIAEFYQPDADVLYHLASVVGIKNYVENPLNLVDVVVIGTRLLLDHVIEHQTRFIYSSTSEVFGKNPAIPWAEDADRVLGPTSINRWSYSSSKAVCEHMIYGAAQAFGLPFTIVRFFNVYGPRQNPIFVVSQSIERVLNGQRPIMYDGGHMTRCYTYVSDILDGLAKIESADAAIGESFNLGNTVPSTVKEVIETILNVTNSDVGYEDLDTMKLYGEKYEDIIHRVPQVTKAKELLDWKATIQLQEGIERTIAQWDS